MFSAFLPGFREFRTPLIAGLLGAACLWILVGSRIAASATTRDFIERFKLSALPSSFWLAAGFMIAYLLGSLIVVKKPPFEDFFGRLRFSLTPIIERLDEQRKPLRWRYRGLWWAWNLHWRVGSTMRNWCIAERSTSADQWLGDEFQRIEKASGLPVVRNYPGAYGNPIGFDGYFDRDTLNGIFKHTEQYEQFEFENDLFNRFAESVKDERVAIETRIQMRFPDVYSEIDRLKVEAELRMSIFWPLMLLSVLLAWAWSPYALLLLVLPPLMLFDGAKRAHEASDKIWSVLAAGEVTSPTLDAMRATESEPVKRFTKELVDEIRYSPPRGC